MFAIVLPHHPLGIGITRLLNLLLGEATEGVAFSGWP